MVRFLTYRIAWWLVSLPDLIIVVSVHLCLLFCLCLFLFAIIILIHSVYPSLLSIIFLSITSTFFCTCLSTCLMQRSCSILVLVLSAPLTYLVCSSNLWLPSHLRNLRFIFLELSTSLCCTQTCLATCLIWLSFYSKSLFQSVSWLYFWSSQPFSSCTQFFARKSFPFNSSPWS